MATAHLLGLGHRKIGLIGDAGRNPYGFAVPERRRNGYRVALEEAGAGPGHEAAGNFTVGGGYEAASELLDATSGDLSALFCLSDKMQEMMLFM